VRNLRVAASWSEDLADRIWSLAHSELSGIRHVVATTASSRVDLARYLDTRFGIGAKPALATRDEQNVAHIGDVELITEHTDSLAAPLQGVVK